MPIWLVACLHNSDESRLLCALKRAVTPDSLAVWHVTRLRRRREKKVSTCDGTFSLPGEALSVCPPVTIDLYQKRIRDVSTLSSNDWHLSVVACLHLSSTLTFSQDVVQHAQNTKNTEIFFINDIFPISTLSLNYKDDNPAEINGTHLNAKGKSVLILQKQSLLLPKLMTYRTMCFIH